MGKKKEYRCTPTFVNLKSNTMKNTVAKVRLFPISANFSCYKACFITFLKIYIHWLRENDGNLRNSPTINRKLLG